MAEGEELINNERDWSDLPADITGLIAKKLPDLLDFVYFRAVCKSWRFSAPLSDPPPQFPWILEYTGHILNYHKLARTRLCFYSITSNRTLTISINNHEWCRGDFFHYLPCYNSVEDVISFFNPLTKKEFVYPPQIVPHPILSPWITSTSASPICDRNIMILDHYGGGWAFYDAQQEIWIEDDEILGTFSCCYWKGKLLSTSSSFKTRVIDISTKKLLYRIPPPEDRYLRMGFIWVNWPYLVESSGEILAVCLFQNWRTGTMEDSKISIFRLDFDGQNGQPCWIRINDIGDRILFLEARNGFSMTATPSTTGFKRGCIYLIDPKYREPYMYNVVTESLETMPCPFKICTWFLPGLN